MTEQLALSFPPPPEDVTLREAAEQWMAEHPVAMALFRRFAADMASRGRRFGIGQLTERVRWECRIEQHDEGDFKINNNWRAYIARALIEENPALLEFIELRKTPAADRPVREMGE